MPSNFTDYGLIGLESRDIRVYEALYRLERGSLRAIASKTGLNRGTVYEIIKKLTSKGLVSFTQSGQRRHYIAAEPELFLSLIRDKRDELKQLETPLVQYAAWLQAQKQPDKTTYLAQFYEGNEGVVSILRDVLQTTQSLQPALYCVISSRRASSFIYANFKSFSRQRVKLGIFARVLSDAPSPGKIVLAERRQLTENQQALNGYILIYGHKTALISLSDTNELSGIVITDPGITNMQRLIFQQLWDTAKTAEAYRSVTNQTIPTGG